MAATLNWARARFGRAVCVTDTIGVKAIKRFTAPRFFDFATRREVALEVGPCGVIWPKSGEWLACCSMSHGIGFSWAAVQADAEGSR